MKKGFTLVELLAVIAILALLVIIAMPNVIGMFNQAKVNTFITDVQKIMDTAVTEFTGDAFSSGGKTIYYSSSNNSLGSSKLNIDTNKEYFIEMDRHGNFKRIVVYDTNYCYDIYTTYGYSSNSDLETTKTKIIRNAISKVTVDMEDIWLSDTDAIDMVIDGEKYTIKGCSALKYYDGTDNGIVPDGGLYTAFDGTIYNPGDRMPNYPSSGDKYSYGDYEYYYNMRRVNNAWVTDDTMLGWGVKAIYGQKETYGVIETYVNNKPIISLNWLFGDGSGAMMKTPPEIPDTVIEMEYAFADCIFANEFPVIPYGVKDIDYAFHKYGFFTSGIALPSGYELPETIISMDKTFLQSALVNAPNIPKGVTRLNQTFSGCKYLVSLPVIDLHHNIWDFVQTFHNCDSLVDASKFVFPESAYNLNHTFSDCAKLVNPPDLSKIKGNSDGQIIIIQTFYNNPLMTGTITINAKSAFTSNNDFTESSKPIIITGTCPNISRYADEYSNITVIQ